MKPDLDAIRARCEAAQIIFERSSVVAPCVYDDIPALLAHIDELERDLLNERATFESCNRARMHCEYECATLKARTTHTIGETEWAHRIATLEHMLAEERARVAELEAEVAILRPWSVMLKRAHGALTDAGCVVPLEFDQSIEHAIKDLANRATRAEQLFVDEHDAHQETRKLLTDLYMKQLRADAAQMRKYGISYAGLRQLLAEYDGGDLSISRVLDLLRAAARELAKEEVAELKARITTLEAMR